MGYGKFINKRRLVMKRKKLAKPILAEGEVTGHMHELKGKVDVYEREDGIREFELSKPTKLTHQEHKTLVITPDLNTSERIREYNPITEEINRVAD